MADTPDAPPHRGPFIVLEGIDGAGTTTQLNLLREHFQRTGRRAFFTHEPSDGPVGMLIRLALQGRLAGDAQARHRDMSRGRRPGQWSLGLRLTALTDRLFSRSCLGAPLLGIGAGVRAWRERRVVGVALLE